MNAYQRTVALAISRRINYTTRENGHITLHGLLDVNYYPLSKNKTAYVAGTVKGFKNTSPEQAIKMCFEAPKSNGKKDTRSKNSKKIRAALIKKGVTRCHWCDNPVNLKNSTLEHIIPLARGGLDNANNRTLACKKCNEKRGSNMPELKGDL